jgi:adenylate cyclase
MALFFLDIRNFTLLAERHQAVDIIHIVKKLFSAFQHIIRSNHGRVIETSGDGFYAAFGFDTDETTAVNDAVNSGYAILQTLEQLNTRSFEKNISQRIEVGIGVHVGKVATGNIHVSAQDHLVVMGYPVNVASRLQAATKELNNSFIISAEVHSLLKGRHIQSSSVAISLKGIRDVLQLHLIGKPYKS